MQKAPCNTKAEADCSRHHPSPSFSVLSLFSPNTENFFCAKIAVSYSKLAAEYMREDVNIM